ncbi:MAG: hypothetical protein OXG82_00590 [Gammaproteobacteria bacterium]|nr:hypothetical protein [Gammaproteobacteria bacterium]
MPDRDEALEGLPADWIDTLDRVDRAPMVVTRSVDRAVGAAAEAQFAARRARPAWRHPGGWAALAASLALVTVVAVRWDGGDEVVYADVDASGRVDIADVLALARSGTASPRELEAFAQRVVALDGVATR